MIRTIRCQHCGYKFETKAMGELVNCPSSEKHIVSISEYIRQKLNEGEIK